MNRLKLLPLAALLLTGACADTPSAPPTFSRPSLAGTPPPPRIEASGTATLSSTEAAIASATGIVAQDACVPESPLIFVLEGTYLRNNPATNAWAHLTPVGGSGIGKIHETQTKQDASGQWTIVQNAVQHDVHLLDYDGTSLFLFADNAGGAGGLLQAEVTACGQKTLYEGTIEFEWGTGIPCSECFD